MRTMRKTGKRFALCIENQDCDDLEVGRDDSGEDYLYPASFFVFVELPFKAERALSAARRRAASRTA